MQRQLSDVQEGRGRHFRLPSSLSTIEGFLGMHVQYNNIYDTNREYWIIIINIFITIKIGGR